MNKVEIANLALGNVRASSINSLDEASLNAQVCKQRIQHCLEFILREHPWRFARRVKPLALTAGAPMQFAYEYLYPEDCLRALALVPNIVVSQDRTILYHFDNLNDANLRALPTSDWELAQNDADERVIWTDLPEAHLAYTARVTDYSRLDPIFVDALAWYLGAQIAVPLVGAEQGRALRKECLQIYSEVLPSAKMADANESKGVMRAPESPITRAR